MTCILTHLAPKSPVMHFPFDLFYRWCALSLRVHLRWSSFQRESAKTYLRVWVSCSGLLVFIVVDCDIEHDILYLQVWCYVGCLMLTRCLRSFLICVGPNMLLTWQGAYYLRHALLLNYLVALDWSVADIIDIWRRIQRFRQGSNPCLGCLRYDILARNFVSINWGVNNTTCSWCLSLITF